MRLTPIFVVLFTFLSGCATNIVPAASGGSRADGTVEMSYEYASLQVPNVDYAAAQRSAVRRCNAWGYDSAESFDTGIRTCTSPSLYGCDAYRVTIEYQCIHVEEGGFTPVAETRPAQKNFRDEIRQIQESMDCKEGARIISTTAESEKWELVCGDGETLNVRCFEDDCYLR